MTADDDWTDRVLRKLRSIEQDTEAPEAGYAAADSPRGAALGDYVVDLAPMTPEDQREPEEWLELADRVYGEFDIDDWAYNRALSRVMRPGRMPSEGAGALMNPARQVPHELAYELMYEALRVRSHRSYAEVGDTDHDYDWLSVTRQEDGSVVVQGHNNKSDIGPSFYEEGEAWTDLEITAGDIHL